ncbi:MAG: N-6 DNA methylase [Synergistaceae bacterium]|nr:N-6 DNA methylase [Synergistaceae bacterium]
MESRERKKELKLGSLVRALREDYESPYNSVGNGRDEFIVAISFLSTLKYKNRKVDLKEEIRSNDKLADLLHVFEPYIDRKMGLIDQLLEEYEIDLLEAAITFDDVYNYRTDLSPTPRGITELALNLLKLEEEDVLLDLGSGKGNFIFDSLESQEVSKVYGVDINPEAIFTSRVRAYFLGREVDFREGNIITNDYSGLGANKIFSNFPLGLRYRDSLKFVEENPKLYKYLRNAPMTITHDWLFVLAGALAMTPGGRFVCLMGKRGTWNAADKEIRERLVEKGLVEGVIELNSGMLPSRRLEVSMLIISEGNREVRMVDAREVYTKVGYFFSLLKEEDVARITELYEKDSAISRSVSFAEIADKGYELSPARYLEYKDDIKEGMPLGELVKDISRGAPLSSRDLSELISKEPTDYRYLLLQNIEDGLIDETLPYLTDLEERYHKYLLKDNSIILSRNAPFKVSSVGKLDGEILATGNLFFLELDESKIDPLYVEAFLQSDRGIAQLERLSKGTGITTINIGDLKEVMIPRLPEEEEREIADKFRKDKMKLRMLMKQLASTREEKAELFREVK